MFKYISENENDRGCLLVVFWFLPMILRYGAHCYLQVGPGAFIFTIMEHALARRPWRSGEPRWAAVKWVKGSRLNKACETPHDVIGDCRLGDLKAKHQEFAMDPGRAPLLVFLVRC
jgi:hypothetical protein